MQHVHSDANLDVLLYIMLVSYWFHNCCSHYEHKDYCLVSINIGVYDAQFSAVAGGTWSTK